MNSTIDTQLPISFTENAVKEIRHLRNSEDNINKGLRIGVEGGGCAGFSYILKFDSKTDNDNTYFIDEVEIYIDKTQEMYIYGTIIDFKQGLDNRGFIYENPNATSTCGCGTSFSA